MAGRVVAHVDMDAFYAAIEQRDNPGLRGLPVIVGAPPNARGVVCAASYEARVFGVRSAMPSREAHRLCPHGMFVPVRMKRYSQVSREVMRILADFSPVLEQISIDEAFLDLTGTTRLLGEPDEVGRKIKYRIRTELDLTASIGIAPNKFLAKVASDLCKPDALVIVRPESVESFLSPLPVSRLWGVGPSTERELHRHGIQTVRQLREYDSVALQRKLGAVGNHLIALSQGIDDRPVVCESDPKSISHETTFEEDTLDVEVMESILFDLVEQVSWRLRKQEMLARTVNLKLRFASFKTITRAKTLVEPTDLETHILEAVNSLFSIVRRSERVRLLGVGVSQLLPYSAGRQLSLFQGENEKRRQAARVADQIKEKFGDGAITKARLAGTSTSRMRRRQDQSDAKK